jgi:hypothetical protein
MTVLHNLKYKYEDGEESYKAVLAVAGHPDDVEDGGTSKKACELSKDSVRVG